MEPLQYSAYLTTSEIDAGLLRVTAFDIDEGVSKEATCVVHATCDVGALDPKALLGSMAKLVVLDDAGTEVRAFQGVIARASERVSTVVDRQELRLTLHSPLWPLRLSSDFRIFQEKTTQEIVSEVLRKAGVPESMVEWRLGGASRKRVTCTQYGETHRELVDRLLEEDGIFWYALHSGDAPKVVFGSGASAWEPSTVKEVPFRTTTGVNREECFRSVRAAARLRPKKFTLRDHDFTKPTLDLERSVEAETALSREHYAYPGGYVEVSDGDVRVAAVRDAQVAAAARVEARGEALRLSAGHEIAVVDTADAAHDGDYVLLEVRHHWVERTPDGRMELATEASMIPASVTFAPEPVTPRPQALGDTAIVTVPAGEEIHCDEHGRVKVQYHWDRYGKKDDSSSGWVRVGQLHTSGSLVIPRVGWEVWVEFEDGDPERPIVLGRLYNAASPPTDALPGGKSNTVLQSFSTPGGGGNNEIRMNDGAGGELVKVNAQKDLNLVVANNKEEKITTTAGIDVKVNQDVTVGASQTEDVSSIDKVAVGGAQTYKVSASRTKTVSGEEKHSVKGARSVTIGASHTTLTPMSVDTSTKGTLSETVGALCLEAAALEVGLAVLGSTSISVGGAKIEAVATGKTDLTVGARATAVGGAFVNVTPQDVVFATKGAKATAVGGAWLGNAGGDAELSSQASIRITVGGAIAFNGATKIVMKVGGSKVTIAEGGVVFESSEVKLLASGPAAETSAMIGSK